MNKEESFIFSSPIGSFTVFHNENRVLEINLGIDLNKKSRLNDYGANVLSPYAEKVSENLEAYFTNSNKKLSIKTAAVGTTFQQSVWKIIQSIKSGKIMTYSDIAEKLGSSPRAVGNACRANPIPIIVPCHRVVAKSGLGGFAGMSTGFNLDMKKWLLAHENVLPKNNMN